MARVIVNYESGDWLADGYSDGSLEVTHKTRLVSDKFFWHTSVTESKLPQRAKDLVISFRNAYRSHFRLALAWRAGTYGVWKKAKRRVCYSRYDWCESAGEWYVPWSDEGRKVI